ncbi:MAG: DUF4136 domain-containing protein [Parabacteroides sp.]|nr:DUF4136 domain-containing protein [Parabacteroides sp.]
MMKLNDKTKCLLLSSILCLTATLCATAQNSSSVCRLGFAYELSQRSQWGFEKPVVRSLIPNSSAEQSGLRIDDVIEQIDGVNVTEVAPEEVKELFNATGNSSVTLTVSNLSGIPRQIEIKKECKKSNAITEDQLASAFAMYSLETTAEQQFICPFKTNITAEEVDFAHFHTFTFARIDENNRKLETNINECIERELIKKGMQVNNTQPDLLVQTFYFFDKNPNYKGTNKIIVEKEPTYRYDSAEGKMVKLPFLNYAAAESEAEYLLQLGIRLVDQKEIPGRVLWECEANELMESSFRLDEYARIHVPLMLMQFPYLKYMRNPQYTVNRRSYNYTGIQYDIDRLELVLDVDRKSPAYAAGIRARDVIQKIGKHKMNHSAEEFSAAYKRFISRTMDLRDPKTRFTDANGFRYCMNWDLFKYTQVADAAADTDYLSAFTYLYYFAPYINPSGNNACVFQVKRGRQVLDITVRPIVRTEVIVEIQ